MNNSAERDYCLSVINAKDRKNAKLSVILMLVICGTIGNLAIVYIFYKVKRLRSTTNKFILNMAIGNLLMPLFGVPLDKLAIFHERNWFFEGTFGLATCKLIYFFREVPTFISIESIVLIAFHRFYAIVYAMRKKHISGRLPLRASLCARALAITLQSPLLHGMKLFKVTNQTECNLSWYPLDQMTTIRIHIAVVLVLFYVLPLASITVFYLSIIISLRRQRQRTELSMNRKTQKQNRENKKVLLMVVTIVIIFFLAYAPLQLFLSISFFSKPSDRFFCTLVILKEVGLFAVYVDFAVNPFLYYVFLDNYRKGFKIAFAPCLMKCFKTKRVQNQHAIQLFSKSG